MTEEHSEKIVVRIGADLEDLIPGFLEGRRKDIVTINGCLEDTDFEKIQLLGHSMKGNGAGYGFDEITEIGRLIEKAAQQENADETKALLERLDIYLQVLEIIYE